MAQSTRLKILGLFVVGLMMSGPLLAQGGGNYLILGVIASSENRQGVALIKDPASGKTFAKKEGQPLGDGIRLNKVFRKHVEIQIEQQKYLIKVGDFTADAVGSGAKSTGTFSIAEGIDRNKNTIRVSSALKEHIVNKQLSTVLMQAASVPFYENGALSGFTLWDIEKGSIYEKFGFQDGDTVTTINEQKINDLGRTVKLLNSLRNESVASITYLRNGIENTVRIEIQ